MTAGKFFNGWTMMAVLLIAIIAGSSVITWSRCSQSQNIEISLVPDRELSGEIYIGGEVNNPGFYPLKDGDGVDDIIRAAGGTTDKADPNRLELRVPEVQAGESPQRVNINRAEAWLLEALPEIGEVRAQAIIDYRQKNGPFHNISELVKVEGIGTSTYEKIKHLITVAD
jgi:competence protein ComEA